MAPKPNLPQNPAPEEALTWHFSSPDHGDSDDSLEYTPPKVAKDEAEKHNIKVNSENLFYPTKGNQGKVSNLSKSTGSSIIQPIIPPGITHMQTNHHHMFHHAGPMSMLGPRESDTPKLFHFGHQPFISNPTPSKDNPPNKGKELSSDFNVEDNTVVMELLEKLSKINNPSPKEPDIVIDEAILDNPQISKASDNNPTSVNQPEDVPVFRIADSSSSKAKDKTVLQNKHSPIDSNIDSSASSLPQPEQHRKVPSLDSGILLIPGHEPEAPADLNLVHHDRSLDSFSDTGITVRDDSSIISPEGE